MDRESTNIPGACTLHHPRTHRHCIIPTVRSTCRGSRAKCCCCPIRRGRRTGSSGKLASSQAGFGFSIGFPVYHTSSRDFLLPALYITAFLLTGVFISGGSTEQTTSSNQQRRSNWTLITSEDRTYSLGYSGHLVKAKDISMKDSVKFTRLQGKPPISSNINMGHSVLPISQNTQKIISESTRLWVFGYGSLVWKTGFKYTSKKVGFVDGFVRRFWQGDTIHRGTKHKPGRVATLEENKSGHVWGVAFELTGRDDIDVALEHLGMRECVLGGYTIRMVPFYSRESPDEAINTLVFVANPENNNYLGQATIEQLTHEIIDSKGNAGHNVEYVTRLADFFREHVPDMDDSHLLDLDNHIRQSLLEKSIDLKNLLTNTATNYNYMYSHSHTEGQKKCSLINSNNVLVEEEEDELSNNAFVISSEENNNNDESNNHLYMNQFPLEIDLFEDVDK